MKGSSGVSANTQYQPPTQDSSDDAAGSGTGSPAQKSSIAEETGSSSEESSETKDSATGSQSGKSSEPTTGSQSTKSSDPTADSQHTKSSESSMDSESVAGSQSSTHSQTSAYSQSTKSSQSSTDSQSTAESQSATGSQSTESSQPSTDSTGSGSNGEISTMTTEIVAPIKSQGGTQSDKESGGDKGSDGLAESFGAARRDLEGTETVEPKNLVTKRYSGMDSLRENLWRILHGYR